MTTTIRPSHIAAARLKVAIAKRKGETVPAWIRELADLDIPGLSIAKRRVEAEQAAAKEGQ